MLRRKEERPWKGAEAGFPGSEGANRRFGREESSPVGILTLHAIVMSFRPIYKQPLKPLRLHDLFNLLIEVSLPELFKKGIDLI